MTAGLHEPPLPAHRLYGVPRHLSKNPVLCSFLLSCWNGLCVQTDKHAAVGSPYPPPYFARWPHRATVLWLSVCSCDSVAFCVVLICNGWGPTLFIQPSAVASKNNVDGEGHTEDSRQRAVVRDRLQDQQDGPRLSSCSPRGFLQFWGGDKCNNYAIRTFPMHVSLPWARLHVSKQRSDAFPYTQPLSLC